MNVMHRSRPSYMFLDEGDVHQRCVGVYELEHESLGDQVVLVLRVRAVVFLGVKHRFRRSDRSDRSDPHIII